MFGRSRTDTRSKPFILISLKDSSDFFMPFKVNKAEPAFVVLTSRLFKEEELISPWMRLNMDKQRLTKLVLMF